MKRFLKSLIFCSLFSFSSLSFAQSGNCFKGGPATSDVLFENVPPVDDESFQDLMSGLFKGLLPSEFSDDFFNIQFQTADNRLKNGYMKANLSSQTTYTHTKNFHGVKSENPSVIDGEMEICMDPDQGNEKEVGINFKVTGKITNPEDLGYFYMDIIKKYCPSGSGYGASETCLSISPWEPDNNQMADYTENTFETWKNTLISIVDTSPEPGIQAIKSELIGFIEENMTTKKKDGEVTVEVNFSKLQDRFSNGSEATKEFFKNTKLSDVSFEYLILRGKGNIVEFEVYVKKYHVLSSLARHMNRFYNLYQDWLEKIDEVSLWERGVGLGKVIKGQIKSGRYLGGFYSMFDSNARSVAIDGLLSDETVEDAEELGFE